MPRDLILIGGHPRSGTALMQGLVCNHPRTISVTREASYFRLLVAAYRFALATFEEHTTDFFDSRRDLTGFHRELLEPFVGRVERRFGDGPGVRVVLKDPLMTEYFPEVIALFPDVKFVVMVRDLRDVIASQKIRAAKEGKPYEPERDFAGYLRTLRRLVMGDDALKGSLLFVRYEALVTRPAEVMDEVWGFLGLERRPVDAGAGWTAKRSSAATATELDGQPPTADHVGAYEKILDAKMLSKIEEVRRLVLTRTRLDPFAGEAPWSGDTATFLLEDIIPIVG